MDHFDGDYCATYPADYKLIVVGDRDRREAGDVEVGQVVRDPASIWVGRWFEVTDVADVADVRHLQLQPASDAEVAQARREACEGHETTRGAIGDTEYCDGACVDGHRGPLT